jgi:hypothetical protein
MPVVSATQEMKIGESRSEARPVKVEDPIRKEEPEAASPQYFKSKTKQNKKLFRKAVF